MGFFDFNRVTNNQARSLIISVVKVAEIEKTQHDSRNPFSLTASTRANTAVHAEILFRGLAGPRAAADKVAAPPGRRHDTRDSVFARARRTRRERAARSLGETFGRRTKDRPFPAAAANGEQ